MKLFSFSFFFLLVQTWQGIEGNVQCGDNNFVPNCRFCYFTSPPAAPLVDRENCNTSPDCKLNEDSSGCVRRSENLPSQAPVLPDNADDSDTNPTSDEVSSEENLVPSSPEDFGQQEVFLSRIKVHVRRNVARHIRQFGLRVGVCNGRNCCLSGTVHSRGGIVTFASAFNNLGNCGQLPKNQEVSMKVFKSTQENYPLDLMRVTITFDDGSVFRKQNRIPCRFWWNCGSQAEFSPLAWEHHYRNMNQVRGQQAAPRQVVRQVVPPAQCPEVTNPNANACPRVNVRVHQQKGEREWKSCYYQTCQTFTADLSSIAMGEGGLGTGGFCAPTAEAKEQYIYCCNLESYFTLPTLNADGSGFVEKDPEEIKFPRCSIMIPHPIP